MEGRRAISYTRPTSRDFTGGTDTISGLSGNDTTCADEGDDIVGGGDGDDHLDGGPGEAPQPKAAPTTYPPRGRNGTAC
jgi:Ca2+-binding RTX toxin-like protein